MNLSLAATQLRRAADRLDVAIAAGGKEDQAQTVGLAEYHVSQATGLLAHWVER